MALLQEYLSAVRMYLPRSADQQDILNELSEHLQSTLDQRVEALGRDLTVDEETAVLWGYGNPAAVAARYGAPNVGLSFGRELIGPEVFPIYQRVLLLQFSLTLIVVTIIGALGGRTDGPLARYLGPMAVQFVVTTTIFIAIDLFKRRSADGLTFSAPMHLLPVPKWQSLSGFVVLSLAAIWWAAIPYAPFLILGSNAALVTLNDSWWDFYWPALLPLLAGAVQRLITFVEPRWSALQAVTRLITNGWAVVLVAQFLAAYPYTTANAPGAEALARSINNALWWNSSASFGLYWLINAGFMAYLCARHAGHYLRRRRDLSIQPTVQS